MRNECSIRASTARSSPHSFGSVEIAPSAATHLHYPGILGEVITSFSVVYLGLLCPFVPIFMAIFYLILKDCFVGHPQSILFVVSDASPNDAVASLEALLPDHVPLQLVSLSQENSSLKWFDIVSQQEQRMYEVQFFCNTVNSAGFNKFDHRKTLAEV